jgi:hypothetical protein
MRDVKFSRRWNWSSAEVAAGPSLSATPRLRVNPNGRGSRGNRRKAPTGGCIEADDPDPQTVQKVGFGVRRVAQDSDVNSDVTFCLGVVGRYSVLQAPRHGVAGTITMANLRCLRRGPMYELSMVYVGRGGGSVQILDLKTPERRLTAFFHLNLNRWPHLPNYPQVSDHDRTSRSLST